MFLGTRAAAAAVACSSFLGNDECMNRKRKGQSACDSSSAGYLRKNDPRRSAALLKFAPSRPTSIGYVRQHDPSRLLPQEGGTSVITSGKSDRGSDEASFAETWRSWAYRDFGKAQSLSFPAVEQRVAVEEGDGCSKKGETAVAVVELATAIAEFEDNPRIWARIDTHLVELGNASDSDISKRIRGAAISDSLALRAKSMPAYRIYLKRDGSELVALCCFAHGTTGYPGILHGGITSLVFDEAMGYMASAARLRQTGRLHLLVPSIDPGLSNSCPHVTVKDTFQNAGGFTAFLKVNYRKPCFLVTRGDTDTASDPGASESALCLVRAQDVKTEGRKMFLKATLETANGQSIYADAEALYIQPRK